MSANSREYPYQPEELEAEFIANLKSILYRLSCFPDQSLRFGPKYAIKSPSGPLKISLIFRQTHELQKLYYLLAKNNAGNIIAMRNGGFFDDLGKIMVKGKIEVGKKSAGLAAPMELAFMHLLQSIANQENRRVVWEVDNENAKNLREEREAMEQKNKNNPATDEDTKRILLLEAEQKRWQHLYGPGGKLGIQPGKAGFDKKEFVPQKPELDFERAGEIELQRVDTSNGQIDWQMTRHSSAPENFQEKEREELLADIKKYLPIAGRRI